MNNLISKLILSLSAFILISSVYAETDSEIISAAKAVAAENASPLQEAVAFKNNQEINNLALEGRIDNSTYQKTQKAFVRKNNELTAAAAARNGMKISGKDKGTYTAGTDSDYQLGNEKGKKLSVEDVVKARKDYNEGVENYLKKSGVKVKPGENYAAKTETDIMPDPNQISPEDFKKSAKYINEDGGNMYKSKKAADTQLKLDTGKNIDIGEGPEYISEMKNKVATMKQDKAKLENELKTTTNPEKKAHLETEMKKVQSHEAKYIERINKLDSQIREQNKIAPSREPLSAGDKALKDAAQRNFPKGENGKMSKSEKGAYVTDSLDKHLTNKAVNNYNNTIAELGKKAAYKSQSQQVIAENLKNLKPAQQGEAIASLEQKYGKEYAKGVVEKMKAPKKSVPILPSASSKPSITPQETASAKPSAEKDASGKTAKKTSKAGTVLNVMGIGSTLLGNYLEAAEDARKTGGKINYGKYVMKSVYDVSLGRYVGVLENTMKAVTVETQEYRRKLEDDYKKSGADMSNFGTQFKIWAQSTAYGSARGIWEAAHATPFVGDIMNAGETAINVVNETANTVDELNVQYANIREQDMRQSVNVAKSVKKGYEMLAALENLGKASETMKAELQRNCLWVNSTSKKYIEWKSQTEEKIRELQDTLKKADEIKGKNQENNFSGADYISGMNKEFLAIKTVVAYDEKSAGEFIKKYEGKTVSAEDRAPVENIINDFKQNKERFENVYGRLKYLSSLEQYSSMPEYIAKFRENILTEMNSIGNTVENARVAFSNIETLLKELDKASRLSVQIRQNLKKAYEYFWKNDNLKGNPEWERIMAKVSLVKNIDFKPEDYRREKDFIRDFPENVRKYVSSIKIPGQADLSWMEGDLRKALNTFNALKKPAEDAAAGIDKASGKIDILMGLLNSKNCTVNIAVLDAITGKPVTAAQVSLTAGNYNAREASSANGAAFNDVPEGKFLVEASAEGYSSASTKIEINPALNLQYKASLKLQKQDTVSVYSSAAAVNEIVKTAKEDEKKYASVPDAELKKADQLINYAYNMLENGTLINRSNMLLRQVDTSSSIANYLGLKYKNGWINLQLLDKNIGNNNVLFEKLSRLAAAKAIEQSSYEYSYYYDKFIKMKTAFETAKIANEPIDPLAEAANAFLDFRIKLAFAATINLSSFKFWRKYSEFQNPNMKKDPKADPLKTEDAEKWAALICKGGYDAVAKELDKFWTDKTNLREKTEFLQENPLAVEDYRSGYIVKRILPSLSAWAKKAKEIREKEFASTLSQLLQPYGQFKITITGKVRCFPDPAPYKVILHNDSGQKKTLAVKDMSGTGEYTFALNFSDLTDTSGFGIKIEPVKEKIDQLNRSGGDSFSFRPDLSSNSSSGIKVALEGSNIKISMPEALITSRTRPKNIPSTAPELPVPSVPSNNTGAYQQLLMAPFNSYKSGEISLEEATRKSHQTQNEFSMVCDDFVDKYYASFEALTHNMGVKRDALNKQKRSSEADAIQKEINKIKDNSYKELEKIRTPWQKMREAPSNVLYKERKELSLKTDAIAARMKKRDELQSILDKEHNETFREFQNAFGKWHDMIRSVQEQRIQRSQYASDNPDVLYENTDKELQKASDDLKGKMASAAEKLIAFSAKASSWMDSSKQLNDELNRLVRAKRGLWKGIDYDDNLLNDNIETHSGMSGGYWYNEIKNDALLSEVIAKSDIKGFIDRNCSRAEAYLKKRGLYSQNIGSMIEEAKKLADQISPEKAAQANAEFETIRNDAWGYAYFLGNAVLSADASVFKPDIKFMDASGNDSDFVNGMKKKLDSLTAKYPELLSHKLLPPRKSPSAFGRLEELLSEIRLRSGDLDSEQQKAFYATQEKYNKILTAAGLVHSFGNLKVIFDEASRVGGSSPEERIKKLIKINSDASKYIQAVSIPSNPEALEKFLADAENWFGKMRNIPTVDALKTRGELYKKLYKSGIMDAYRKSRNMPPCPEAIMLNGKSMPYDGSTIIFRLSQLPAISRELAETYAKSGNKDFKHSLYRTFKKNPEYRMEQSMDGVNFYDAGDAARTYEEPFNAAWLPRTEKVYYRQSDKFKNSKIPNEPPLTIIVLP